MNQTIKATFATRRDAEMAIEHIVQEHGVERTLVSVLPENDENSAGTLPAGGDLDGGGPRKGATGQPQLVGRLAVTVTVGDDLAEQVRSAFQTYSGKFAT